MQPIETLSVVSELPEFSQTLDTTLTNSSNGSSPPQQSITNDTSNKELSSSNSTGNGDTTNQNKRNCLRSCIIRLTELSSKERDRWMTSNSRSMTTSSETEGISTSANDSRYNIHTRPLPTETSNRSTGRKCAMVYCKEQGFQDSGRESDYEVTPKPPQPLDNKSYPSASRIATQRMIESNKANNQTKNDGSLPVTTEPL